MPTSMPASMPTSEPASEPAGATQETPSSLPAAPLIIDDEDAALCLSEDPTIDAGERELACQQYLLKEPEGELEVAVRRRLLALLGKTEETPETNPVQEDGGIEDYLYRLKHPRKTGDLSFQLVAGLNTPNNTVGLQGGYYFTPQIHGGLSLGGGVSGVRAGLWGRAYFDNARITPLASLAFSFSPGRTGLAPQPSDGPGGGSQLVRVDFGPSALAHAGVGFSLRNINGMSASIEAGYALPLFRQSITNAQEPETPLPDPDALRDGGIFLALSAGVTF